MALRFVKEIDITAASQFLGSELDGIAPSKDKRRLIVREISIIKGAENAQIRVVKRAKDNGGTLRSYDLQAVNTGTTTFITLGPLTLSPNDRITDLLPGESIGIISTGATQAMFARVQYEDAPNDLEPLVRDPKVTR